MSENNKYLFLISCDEVPSVGFNEYEKVKITIECPEIDFFQRALEIIDKTATGSCIAVSGLDSLAVLKAQTLSPGHFENIILIEPKGAFWWEDNSNKPKYFFEAFDLFHKITCKVIIYGTGKDLPAWTALLKNADLTINWNNREFPNRNEDIFTELAALSGIKVKNVDDFLVKGHSYTRYLSCDIGWEEPDVSNPKKKISSRSIISSLGWQWEKHWNVYTEEAPFGLMLSVLNEFLIDCIRIFHYRPMYIEWFWDGEDYFVSKIKPADEYPFSRAVQENSFPEAGSEAWNIVSLFNKNVMMLNEPLNISSGNSTHANLDVLYYCYKDLGIKGNFTDEFEVKFDLLRYLNSLTKISKMNSIIKFFEWYKVEHHKRMKYINDEEAKGDFDTLFEARRKIVQILAKGK